MAIQGTGHVLAAVQKLRPQVEGVLRLHQAEGNPADQRGDASESAQTHGPRSQAGAAGSKVDAGIGEGSGDDAPDDWVHPQWGVSGGSVAGYSTANQRTVAGGAQDWGAWVPKVPALASRRLLV